MSIKDDLLKKINARVKRKKDLSEEIAKRSENVEVFVVKMIEEIEEALISTVNTSLFEAPHFRQYYVKSVEGRIRTLDNDATIEVSWHESVVNNSIPRVNGILIKWSKQYQIEHSCEEQLFVDLTSLLFK
jgi:hypothetical protein